MISFNKDSAWDLKPIPVSDVRGEVNGLLIDGEEIAAAFKTVRDQLIFTNKRVISVDVQDYRKAQVLQLYALFESAVFLRANPRICRNHPG